MAGFTPEQIPDEIKKIGKRKRKDASIALPVVFKKETMVSKTETNEVEVKKNVPSWKSPKPVLKDKPPFPERFEGEDSMDYAFRKNEWKRLYGN